MIFQWNNLNLLASKYIRKIHWMDGVCADLTITHSRLPKGKQQPTKYRALRSKNSGAALARKRTFIRK